MTDERTEADRLREQGLDVETVGEIMERERAEAGIDSDLALADSSAFVLPVREGYSQEPLPPGIYFNLPEAIYHAVPALSSGGVKNLAISPIRYWYDTRWLNPDWEEREDAPHFILGRAYETLILEGREAFEARFATAPDRRDYPGVLVTRNDIKERLNELGIEKCPTSKVDAIAKLRTFEPDVQLWDEIEAAAAEANEGKCVISASAMHSLEIAARIVQRDENMQAAITGGHPQVSLFWNCPKTGVPCKARVDYLMIQAMLDAKSMREKGRSIEAAISREIASLHYNFQANFYLEGAAEVRKLVRKEGVVFGCEGIDDDGKPIIGRAEPNAAAWAERWASHKLPDEWLWLFFQTTPPIARLALYPRAGTTKMVTDDLITAIKRRFIQFAKTYGADPWLDLGPIIYLNDDDIPKWSTEI